MNDPPPAVSPDLAAQKPDFAYTLLRRAGRHEEARAILRPLLSDPDQRAAALGALIIDPDALLAAETADQLARQHQTIPEALLTRDLTTRDRAALGLAATVPPMHRETLYALRDAKPNALCPH